MDISNCREWSWSSCLQYMDRKVCTVWIDTNNVPKDDIAYAELLNILREGKHTDQDVCCEIAVDEFIKSRLSMNIPTHQ